jgi:hypothetical protein
MTPAELRPKVDILKKYIQGLDKWDKRKLAKTLVENFNKHRDPKGCCGKMTVKRLLVALELKKSKGYSVDDWNIWAGKHEGTWNKKRDNAEWAKAKKKGKQVIQEVTWEDERGTGYNITFADGTIGGYDPKKNDPKNLWKVHFGIPIDGACRDGCKCDKKKCCRCILWVVPAKKFFLECIGCKGKKISIPTDTKYGWGKWTVTKKSKSVRGRQKGKSKRIGK